MVKEEEEEDGEEDSLAVCGRTVIGILNFVKCVLGGEGRACSAVVVVVVVVDEKPVVVVADELRIWDERDGRRLSSISVANDGYAFLLPTVDFKPAMDVNFGDDKDVFAFIQIGNFGLVGELSYCLDVVPPLLFVSVVVVH